MCGTSDTETLLQGYARWGHNVLDHLKGMFAFAIYDVLGSASAMRASSR
jgi:asparagine synthetase B (glutamine-hydrolysing)